MTEKEASKLGNGLGSDMSTSSEQIDFRQILFALWKRRNWIAGISLATCVMGAVYAFLAHPAYYAEAIIAPKSSGADSRQGVLSQLGGLGFVASQLGMGNNNLDHLEVMLKSKGLAEKVIESYNLLPRLFPEPSGRGKGSSNGKDGNAQPTLRDGIELLTGGMVKVASDTKKQVISVGVEANDPGLASELVEMYLKVFNEKLQTDVKNDADSNIHYLESQLSKVTDPLLGEKIQGLIAGQLEKSMLMSSNSFDILERPFIPLLPIKPKRTMIVLLAFFSGLMLSSFSFLLADALKETDIGFGKDGVQARKGKTETQEPLG
jgi:uncharacterized protein involved in exopolysaccharide biosynthesis